MKTHAIIPIFIPHRGCGHACVFCNQRIITARQPDVTPEDVRGILDTWLSTMQRQGRRRLDTIEAAFYGGSFTGLPQEEQAAFLTVVREYKDRGLIDRIHLSTRPDYIDEPVLDLLRSYGADIIELGVQSFDPEVLAASRRGHTAADIYRACELIRSYGFSLGIQLMIGLPGDSYEKCLDSARQTAALHPDLARLYPTVVLRDTELARMYAAGTYRPPSTEEAVSVTKDMYRILDQAGITILRVGLKSTDLITGSAVQGRSYHPAFRQLVEGALAREDLEGQLLRLLGQDRLKIPQAAHGQTSQNQPLHDQPSQERQLQVRPRRVTFCCCGESFSNMIGHKACNKKYFAVNYPALSFRFTVDRTLPRGSYQVKIDD